MNVIQYYSNCVLCRRPARGIFCFKHAKPDPERLAEMKASGETSAQRRARWRREDMKAQQDKKNSSD